MILAHNSKGNQNVRLAIIDRAQQVSIVHLNRKPTPVSPAIHRNPCTKAVKFAARLAFGLSTWSSRTSCWIGIELEGLSSPPHRDCLPRGCADAMATSRWSRSLLRSYGWGEAGEIVRARLVLAGVDATPVRATERRDRVGGSGAARGRVRRGRRAGGEADRARTAVTSTPPPRTAPRRRRPSSGGPSSWLHVARW